MKKKILSMILCLMMFAATISNSIVASAADMENMHYDKEKVLNYITNKEYPKTDNKVFAGWYEDEAYTKPIRSVNAIPEGGAYAKFLNAGVLATKFQVKANTTTASESTNLRLVSTVDSDYFRNVGFKLTVGGKTVELTSSKVYSSLNGYVDDEKHTYFPNTAFDPESKYFIALTINEIIRSAFKTDILVEAFWTTLDGTIVYGSEKKIRIEDVVDYDNGVDLSGYIGTYNVLKNDFAQSVDGALSQVGDRTAFFGSTATLQDGWARIVSSEHVFVYGEHGWGAFGGVRFEKNAIYKASLDLKLGSEDANKIFNLYVMTEKADTDPRFGNVVKTLTLDFTDPNNLVTANTEDFAHVFYAKNKNVAHIEIVFTADANKNTLLVSRCSGSNDWLFDNLFIQKIVAEKDYDNGIDFSNYTVVGTKFENDFSEDANKGVTAAWHKSPFYGSTVALENGWARVTSTEHLFVYGGHNYGSYGGFGLTKGVAYKTSFDLKLGTEDANKIFNLYVMTEKVDTDPRFGDIVKTLTLNFADFDNFVTANTEDFAHVTYSKDTHVAHIEIVFTTDANVNTLLVSRCSGSNDWLIDNLIISELEMEQVEKDYDNGIDFSDYTVVSTKFENDFSEDANKGVTAAWHKSPFYGSTVALENGWARVTSTEHLFVYGEHAYGSYGGFGLTKGVTYKTSFDLKLGAEDANKIFNLYVMTEKADADPRFGDIVKTLTINMADLQNLVTENTDDFASVRYNSQTETVHIEIVYQTDDTKNTDLVSRCAGTNNWLIDNLKFEEVTRN